jgi:hypothetical protein
MKQIDLTFTIQPQQKNMEANFLLYATGFDDSVHTPAGDWATLICTKPPMPGNPDELAGLHEQVSEAVSRMAIQSSQFLIFTVYSAWTVNRGKTHISLTYDSQNDRIPKIRYSQGHKKPDHGEIVVLGDSDRGFEEFVYEAAADGVSSGHYHRLDSKRGKELIQPTLFSTAETSIPEYQISKSKREASCGR